MKKIFFFSIFVFFLVILLLKSESSKAADYADCSPNYVNASGEINLGGVPAPSAGVCMTEATSYQITIYKVYLCTSAPTVPTVVSPINISSCSVIFENSSGSTITVSTNGSTSLSGSITKPPAGNYTHAYVNLDNVLGITGKVSFSDQQYDGQGSQGSGFTCVTRSTSKENLTGTTFPQTTSECGDSSLSASNKLIEFQSLDCCTGLLATDLTTDIDINGSGQDGIPSIVDTNGLLITSEENADKIDYIVDFNSTLSISENITKINLRFNVSSSLEVNNYVNNFILFMPGPPQIIIETTN